MIFEKDVGKDIPVVTIVVAVVVLALGLWYYTQYFSEEKKEEESAPQMLVVPFSMQNDSGQIGNAVFREQDGKVFVEVDVFNAPKGVAQPAHIHEGSCPNPGAVKYPLTSLVNGQSETALDVTLEDILSHLPLAVNVHKSEKEAGIYVSCGNISRENLMPEKNNSQPVSQVPMPPPPLDL